MGYGAWVFGRSGCGVGALGLLRELCNGCYTLGIKMVV